MRGSSWGEYKQKHLGVSVDGSSVFPKVLEVRYINFGINIRLIFKVCQSNFVFVGQP